MTATMNLTTDDTVTFNPAEVFMVADLAKAVGRRRDVTHHWVGSRLTKGMIPAPLLALRTSSGLLRVWTSEQGREMVALYLDRDPAPLTHTLPARPMAPTVTVNPNEVFVVGDLAKAAGVTRHVARYWVDRRLAKGMIPAPLFSLPHPPGAASGVVD